ncbi:DUF1697 domain-containing protein [Ornithinimicrobium avium]|uniref:DUF1697 domain-containing protein n=1 Tax=Ornithinimicrobium avium TaxID=2283195 RepID=A0A345NK38_9MICO|nr:DUF1697 domain-containing protein [Ornithinimicrobium avium]AXH95396.1 DUF1697 domain-containing protein [Ornithinimicrobium avium]
MTRYAALLRGIMPSNPSMRNERLREVFEGLGLEQVGSVLASGNIVFTAEEQPASALEDRIQAGLKDGLGIAGGTIVRELAELRALLDSDPFPGLTHGRGTYLTATFLKDGALGEGAEPPRPPEQPDPLARVVGYDAQARAFLAVVDNSVPGRTPDLMTWLERSYGTDITTRTWLTVQRIVKKLEA